MVIPVGEGTGRQYIAAPGFTDRLTWQIDPTTYNDADFLVRLSVAIVLPGTTPTTWAPFVDLPTTASSADYVDPQWVVNGLLQVREYDVHYRLQLIRRADGSVRWTSAFGPIPRQLGRCRND